MSAALDTTPASATRTRRVVYFRGHVDEDRSALITQLAAGYQTISALIGSSSPGSSGGSECATRTLLNLYNLHACRGLVAEQRPSAAASVAGVGGATRRTLDFPSCMSGPHHYFGWVDPRETFVIEEAPADEVVRIGTGYGLLRYRQVKLDADLPARPLLPVPADKVAMLRDYDWRRGSDLDDATRTAYAVAGELATHLVDTRSGSLESSSHAAAPTAAASGSAALAASGAAGNAAAPTAQSTPSFWSRLWSSVSGSASASASASSAASADDLTSSAVVAASVDGAAAVASTASTSGAAAGGAGAVDARAADPDARAADSLFDEPGLLLLPEPRLDLPLLVDPHLFDLSPFHAQIVRNDTPFRFDQALVSTKVHAQHRLRVVTYNYGDDYYRRYLMRPGGSGSFIERHEFIQAITPATPECGGFVILGREMETDAATGVEREVGVGEPSWVNSGTPSAEGGAPPGSHRRLELVACPVPYGYTLVVDSGSIHGDSTLTGLYMMAMTGEFDLSCTKQLEAGRCVTTVASLHSSRHVHIDEIARYHDARVPTRVVVAMLSSTRPS